MHQACSWCPLLYLLYVIIARTMDTLTQEVRTKRRDPLSDEPIRDEDNKVIEIRAIRSDDVLFEVLARFQYGTIDWLAAHTGRHPVAVRRRVMELIAKPGSWLTRVEWQTK